jgi:hypothetical protein
LRHGVSLAVALVAELVYGGFGFLVHFQAMTIPLWLLAPLCVLALIGAIAVIVGIVMYFQKDDLVRPSRRIKWCVRYLRYSVLPLASDHHRSHEPDDFLLDFSFCGVSA